MVRDRVDGWRLAWRFALAGVVAGLLVVTLAQTAFTAGTFDAAQDRLFPAPAPDPRITLVAIDQTSANNLGGYPLVSNAYHAQVINYLMSLHPSVILFDVPLSVETPPSPEPPHDDTNQPLVDALKKAASKIVLVCTADQRPDKLFEVGELVGEPPSAPQMRRTRSATSLSGRRRHVTRTRPASRRSRRRCESPKGSPTPSRSAVPRRSSGRIRSRWPTATCSSTSPSARGRPVPTRRSSPAAACTPSSPSPTTSSWSVRRSSTPATCTPSPFSSTTTEASARPAGRDACSTTRTTATASRPTR